MPNNYLLPVWNTVVESWEKVSGSKKTFWAAFFIYLIIMFVIGLLVYLFEQIFMPLAVGLNAVTSIINYLFMMGLFYIGIQRARGLPINYRMVYEGFKYPKALKLIGVYILQFLLLLIPIILMVIGASIMTFNNLVISLLGILILTLGLIGLVYIAMRAYTSAGFVLDQNLGPLQAIKASFKVTRHNVARLLATMLISLLILFISIIPLGIGLIWTMPFVFILFGVIYNRLLTNLR